MNIKNELGKSFVSDTAASLLRRISQARSSRHEHKERAWEILRKRLAAVSETRPANPSAAPASGKEQLPHVAQRKRYRRLPVSARLGKKVRECGETATPRHRSLS